MSEELSQDVLAHELTNVANDIRSMRRLLYKKVDQVSEFRRYRRLAGVMMRGVRLLHDLEAEISAEAHYLDERIERGLP